MGTGSIKCSVALRTIEEITNMSFREQIREEVEEANSGSDNGSDEREELEQIEVDMGSIPFVKFTPTTLLGGTFPEDEGNPIILFKNYDRLDEMGADAKDESGNDLRPVSTRYLGLVVDDLRVVQDEDEGLGASTIIKTGDDDSTAYRAVNLDDDQTSYKYDGAAIDVSGDVYDVEDEVTQIDGRSILVVDRTAAQSVAQKLDRNGGVAAGMDESGDINDGLIEYPTSDADADEARYARPFVELRDEFYGQEIGIMVTRRSEVDEDYAELVEAGDARDMMWYSVFDMETETSIEPTTGDTAVQSYLQWNFDPEAGRIPDDQWEFVEEYVEAGLPADEDTIRDNISDNADNFDSTPEADRIVELVQNMAQA